LTLAIPIALVAGLFLGKFVFKRSYQHKEAEAEKRADEIIRNAEVTAENTKKDRILEAKEKFLKLRAEFEEESNRKRNLLNSNEQKLRQKEQSISQSLEQNKRREAELENLKNTLAQQLEVANLKREEAEK